MATATQAGTPAGKDASLDIRLSSAEKEAFHRAAELADFPSLSAWVLFHLRKQAREVLTEHDEPVPFDAKGKR